MGEGLGLAAAEQVGLKKIVQCGGQSIQLLFGHCSGLLAGFSYSTTSATDG
jgi:hypothetical protein